MDTIIMGKLQVFNKDNRSLAITIDYVIGLGIILLLSAILLTGVFAIQDERRDEVHEQEVERVHETVHAEIEAIMRSADEISTIGSGDNVLNVTTEINDKLPQDQVSIEITEQSLTTFEVVTRGSDFTRTTNFDVNEYNNIGGVNISGFATSESFKLSYNSTSQQLTINRLEQ